jgi:hypothetical protein
VALTINDLPVPGIDPATFVYAFTVAPDTMVLADDVHATTQGSANVDVTVTPVGAPVTGYTVVVAVDNGVGAPVDYTVNVTFA